MIKQEVAREFDTSLVHCQQVQQVQCKCNLGLLFSGQLSFLPSSGWEMSSNISSGVRVARSLDDRTMHLRLVTLNSTELARYSYVTVQLRIITITITGKLSNSVSRQRRSKTCLLACISEVSRSHIEFVWLGTLSSKKPCEQRDLRRRLGLVTLDRYRGMMMIWLLSVETTRHRRVTTPVKLYVVIYKLSARYFTGLMWWVSFLGVIRSELTPA